MLHFFSLPEAGPLKSIRHQQPGDEPTNKEQASTLPLNSLDGQEVQSIKEDGVDPVKTKAEVATYRGRRASRIVNDDGLTATGTPAGAQAIGELLKLGFHLSEPTVSRWLRRVPRILDPAKRWMTFLRNHREAIASMDFFTVPTLTYGILYYFFVIGHDRRKILGFNVTRNPNAFWIGQQLWEA